MPAWAGHFRRTWTTHNWKACCFRHRRRCRVSHAPHPTGRQSTPSCIDPGVTLMLLWEEYRVGPADGFGYRWLCDHCRFWAGKLNVAMRQCHRAGEKLFVGYAGQTVELIDRTTGEVRTAQIFAAALGASSYTCAEANWTQNLSEWIGSHVRTLAYLGGVPELVVPDKLRSGVSCAHRYEPDINPTYADMARHHGAPIVPARVRKPRDKAKAENGVQLIERWILAALRNRTFFSLRELNEAIGELLKRLSQQPFKKLSGSRQSAFETLDQPVLRPSSHAVRVCDVEEGPRPH